MQAPAVDGAFDLILVPFNSLAYLTAREDRRRLLPRRALAPRSRRPLRLRHPPAALRPDRGGDRPRARRCASTSTTRRAELGIDRFLRTTTTPTIRHPDAALDQPLRGPPQRRPRRPPDRRPRLAHLLPGGARAAARGRRAGRRGALRRLRPRPLDGRLPPLPLGRGGALPGFTAGPSPSASTAASLLSCR